MTTVSAIEKPKQMKPSPMFFDANSMVTFKIVADPEFVVHKEVACCYSVVLGKAFNGRFLEGRTQTYTMEDTTPRAFRYLVRWLYSQRLSLNNLGPGNKAPENGEFDPSENMALTGLWILADKLFLPELQNLILDGMYQSFLRNNNIPTSAWKYIFENTAEDSKLREYTIAFVTCYVIEDSYERFEERGLLQHGLLLRVAKTWARGRFGAGSGIKSQLSVAKYYAKVDE